MIATWQTVRVFVSSTFRDMQAERDHLVKVTFPRLRQWCEERRLHLVDIDLRWGVTKEEADNGKSIEICLQEIDGSRPFFVCALGNRYGWVPHDLPSEEHYLFRDLQQETGLSITHLEIIHATQQPVRRRDGERKDICRQAFFYFRDPNCVPTPESLTGLTAQQRQLHDETFFEQNPVRRGMLDELKMQIRKAFRSEDRVHDYAGVWVPEAENLEDGKLKGRLTSLEAFGDRVELDLKRAIEAQCADHLATLSQKPDPLAVERSLHEAFVENRTQVHVPRVDVERDLTAYANDDDVRSCVVSGPPGSGKSSILAHWTQERLKGTGQTAKDEVIVARFIGASPASTSLRGLLGNVCEELRCRFDLTEEVEEDVPDEGAPGGATRQGQKRRVTRLMEVPADPIEVQNKWPQFLEAAGARGKVVIVLDAVNQLERSADPSRAYWIPRKLPKGVRLIVSALDHGEASKPATPSPQHSTTPSPQHSIPAAHPDWLAALRRLDLHEVPVPDLDDEARKRILRELPSVFCKTLEPRLVEQLLANPATRNPLFLIVALEELRVFGSFERLPQRIAELPQLGPVVTAGETPATAPDAPRSTPHAVTTVDVALDQLFGQVLDRLDRESRHLTPNLVPKLFSLLSCARDGLAESEMQGLLARALPDLDEKDRAGNMQVALRQVRPYLQRKQSQGTVLVDYYHRSFWKAVVGKYLGADEAKAATHVELAEYFETLDWFAESLEEQRARAKRLPPTPRPVTLRKVVELPWQRLEAATLAGKDDPRSPHWDKVADLLTNWQFLEAKAEADPNFREQESVEPATAAGEAKS